MSTFPCGIRKKNAGSLGEPGYSELVVSSPYLFIYSCFPHQSDTVWFLLFGLILFLLHQLKQWDSSRFTMKSHIKTSATWEYSLPNDLWCSCNMLLISICSIKTVLSRVWSMLPEEKDLSILPLVRDMMVLPKPLAIASFVSLPSHCWKTPHLKDLGYHLGWMKIWWPSTHLDLKKNNFLLYE